MANLSIFGTMGHGNLKHRLGTLKIRWSDIGHMAAADKRRVI